MTVAESHSRTRLNSVHLGGHCPRSYKEAKENSLAWREGKTVWLQMCWGWLKTRSYIHIVTACTWKGFCRPVRNLQNNISLSRCKTILDGSNRTNKSWSWAFSAWQAEWIGPGRIQDQENCEWKPSVLCVTCAHTLVMGFFKDGLKEMTPNQDGILRSKCKSSWIQV